MAPEAEILNMSSCDVKMKNSENLHLCIKKRAGRFMGPWQ